MEETKKWTFVRKIEEMSKEDLEKRIQEVMDYEIPSKINPVPYKGEVNQWVEYRCPELTARCPMTGIRDFYDIQIQHTPDKLIPELKSLKLYFQGYDEIPISHEHIAAKIYHDFKKIIQPKELKIILNVAVRGGITTTIIVDSKNKQ